MKLGETQFSVLVSLCAFGQWPGGWVWGSASETQRILQSLKKHGLVSYESNPSKMDPNRKTWRPTEAGRKALDIKAPSRHRGKENHGD